LKEVAPEASPIGGGADGSGIGGGADGSGIGGGADGVGVGGIAQASRYAVTLSIADPKRCVEPSVLPHRQALLQDLCHKLMVQSDVQVHRFVRRTADAGIETIAFRSLGGFFKLFLKKSMFPVISVRAKDEKELPGDSELITEAHALEKQIALLQPAAGKADAFLKEFQTLTRLLLLPDGGFTVARADLDRLLDTGRAEWKILFDRGFDETVRLIRQAQRVRDLLTR
jgi:hypothetical protein